jgi:hypothetical protein
LLLSAMIAAAAIAFSPISVIGNSLRLRRIDLWSPTQNEDASSMADDTIDTKPWRCSFCRMHTGVKLFGIPVCQICQDQVQDFVLVSGILGALVASGFLSGLQFAVEEVLLFGVLVLVKHRLPRIFDRFLRKA